MSEAPQIPFHPCRVAPGWPGCVAPSEGPAASTTPPSSAPGSGELCRSHPPAPPCATPRGDVSPLPPPCLGGGGCPKPQTRNHGRAKETPQCVSVRKASVHISAETGLRTRCFLSFLSPMLTKMSSPALLPPAECVCFLAPRELLSADAVCFGSQASLGCRILPLAGTQTPPVPGIRIVSQSADQAALSLRTQGKPPARPRGGLLAARLLRGSRTMAGSCLNRARHDKLGK